MRPKKLPYANATEKEICRSKIIRGKPFFWFILKVIFKPKNPKDVVVAFGRRIYAEVEISPMLLTHEETHLEQHGWSYIGALWWWCRYLLNPAFRYTQELAAYRRQYQSFCGCFRHPLDRTFYARQLATHLSGPLYGKLSSFDEAVKEITR